MIKLRPHHLICLKFYRGYCYSARMKQELDGLISKLATGEKLRLIMDPDDVCIHCPYLSEDRCAKPGSGEILIRSLDEAALKLLGLSEGAQLSWNELALDREQLRRWRELACKDCDWNPLCWPSWK